MNVFLRFPDPESSTLRVKPIATINLCAVEPVGDSTFNFQLLQTDCGSVLGTTWSRRWRGVYGPSTMPFLSPSLDFCRRLAGSWTPVTVFARRLGIQYRPNKGIKLIRHWIRRKEGVALCAIRVKGDYRSSSASQVGQLDDCDWEFHQSMGPRSQWMWEQVSSVGSSRLLTDWIESTVGSQPLDAVELFVRRTNIRQTIKRVPDLIFISHLDNPAHCAAAAATATNTTSATSAATGFRKSGLATIRSQGAEKNPSKSKWKRRRARTRV